MKRISAAELMRNFGLYSDKAINEPVIITKHGRERLVLMNVEEFNHLSHGADIGKEEAETRKAPRKASGKPAGARLKREAS